jgi:outer membrane protein TolC
LDQPSRGAGFGLTQPLWKGAGTDVGLAALRTARINRIMSRGSLELSTQNLIFQVRSNYAEVVRQLQLREVNRQAVRTAQTFLAYTQQRERVGFQTRLDVSQAKVQLQQRELALITNVKQLEDALDQLKLAMNLDLEYKIQVRSEHVDYGEKPPKGFIDALETDEEKGIVYLVRHEGTDASTGAVKGEKRVLFQAQHFNEKSVLEEAMLHRIDLLNQRRALAVQQLNTMLAKNNTGYQVDLVGSYGHTFTSKALRGYGSGTNSAVETSSDANAWTAGVNVSIPWGKISDRAAYEKALLELQKSEIGLKQSRTTVHEDVRSIMRTMNQDERTLLTNALLVEQAKLTVEATRIQFERGLKDSLAVVQVEDQLLSAKSDFISGRLNYIVDLARLEVVIGKATGRVDLEGETLGGQITTRLPDSMAGKQDLRYAPDAEPNCEDNALNNSRRYRCDPKPEPDTRLIVTPHRTLPPCLCEIIESKP